MQNRNLGKEGHVLGRRDAIAAAGAGLLMGCEAARSDDLPPVPVIDTHLHCFAGESSRDFPYHKNAPYRPSAAATPEYLLECMDLAGVDYAVVVHPEPYQDDHRYLEYCLKMGNGRLKGTLLLFSDRPNSIGKIGPLTQELDIVAVRVHAYAPDRLPPFGTKELRELWKWADLLGLAVQLHFEPKYAPKFEPLIREFKNVRVLIDHLGRPFQGLPSEHEKVIAWSKFPNTIMKLSSIPSENNYPHRDIRPILRRITDAYGADRLMYGGGFNSNATGVSYRAAFDRARNLLDYLSGEEQGQIFGGTAMRLFRFDA